MFRTRILAAMLLTGVALLAAPRSADAGTILVFGQNGVANTVTATDVAGTTTISAVNVAITISAIDAGFATPLQAFLNLTATNTSDAVLSPGGDIVQDYSGSFTITSAINGAGINFLSGVFTDTASGAPGGTSLTLNAADPPDTVTFTSDVIFTLGDPTSIAFAFTNLTPPLSIDTGGAGVGDDTINGFNASVAGNMSATGIVPAPAGLLLLAAGSPLLGFAGWRKWRKRA